MKKILPLACLFLSLSSPAQKPSYFIAVYKPAGDNCWKQVCIEHHQVYKWNCCTEQKRRDQDSIYTFTQKPELKGLEHYSSFRRAAQIAKPLEADEKWNRDFYIIIIHKGCFEQSYKFKTTEHASRKQRKFQQIVKCI